MAMIPDNEIRKKARARLEVKKLLEKLFFVSLGLPFFLAIFVDRVITESTAVLWISVYFILSLINIIAWRCSGCEKQLSHLRRTDFSYIPRFCRHCGVLLFPEVPPNDVIVSREHLKMRPKFLFFIIALGILAGVFGYVQNLIIFTQIGGGVVSISLMVVIAVKNSRSRSCKSCGHIGINGKFCDNCGTKYFR